MKESGNKDFGPLINADERVCFQSAFIRVAQRPAILGLFFSSLFRRCDVSAWFRPHVIPCCLAIPLHMPTSAAVLDEVTHEFSRRPTMCSLIVTSTLTLPPAGSERSRTVIVSGIPRV